MKAIETKYLPATARKGSRIVASDSDGNRATISYPSELKMGEACHRAAAFQLCRKMKWDGELIGAETRRGWVFIWFRWADWAFDHPEQIDELAAMDNLKHRQAVARKEAV